MYAVSAGFKTAVKEASRVVSSRVTIGTTTYGLENIVSFSYEDTSNPGSSFELGSAAAAQISLELVGVINHAFEAETYTIDAGIEVNGVIEWVPLGKFYADKVERKKDNVKLTLFDGMLKLEKAYFSALTYPATITNVMNEIGTKAGVTISGTFPAYSIPKPEGYTYREVVSFIAQLCGGFAKFDRAGNLTIKSYATTTTDTVTSSNYIDYNKKRDSVFKITAFRVQVAEDTFLTKGTRTAGTAEIGFENPFMTDAILTDVYNKLNGFEYIPISLQLQGNPAIECGDRIQLTTFENEIINIPVMKHNLEFSGGLLGTIDSEGESENQNQFDSGGTVSKRVERVVQEQALINEALINKATIDQLEAAEARITTLEASSATIEDLSVTTAKIANLAVTTAKIADLAVDTAKIKDLTVSTAKIGELAVTGAKINNLAVGSAQIADLSVINGKIGNLAVDSAKIVDLAVTNAKIANAAINNAKIEDASISTAKIQLTAITTGLIADAAITSALIKDASITGAKIVDATITDAKIGSISAGKITTGILDAAKIVVKNLSADSITTGELIVATSQLMIRTDFPDLPPHPGSNSSVKTGWHNRNEYELAKYATVDTVNKFQGANTIFFQTESGADANIAGYPGIQYMWDEWVAGETYTLSFYWKGDNNKFSLGIYFCESTYPVYNELIYSNYYDTPRNELPWDGNVNTWRRHKVTFTIPPGGSTSGYSWIAFYLEPATSPTTAPTATWRIAKPMLQRGTLATLWQPNTSELLATGGIGADKFADDSVDNRILAANAVTANEIVARTITGAKIKSASITATDAVFSGAVIGQAQIIDGSITNAKIADATIQSAKIASLDASKITATTLSAISANLGFVTAGTIDGGTVIVRSNGTHPDGTAIRPQDNYIELWAGKLYSVGESTAYPKARQQREISIKDGVITGEFWDIAANSYSKGHASSYELGYNGAIFDFDDEVGTHTIAIGRTGIEFDVSYIGQDTSGRKRIYDDNDNLIFWVNPTNGGEIRTASPFRALSTASFNSSISVAGAATIGSTLVVDGIIENRGFDFKLGNGDQSSRGNSGASRAMVKTGGVGIPSELIINYGNDFSGGVEVQSKLYVKGPVDADSGFYTNSANGNFQANNGYLVLRSASNNLIYLQGSEVRAVSPSTTTSWVTFRAGTIYQNGSQVSSSAILKANIKLLNESYDSIAMLKEASIYTYHYQHDIDQLNFDNKQVGMIAEGIPQILKGADGDSVNLYAVISFLWDATRRQQELIENLQKEVYDLQIAG